MAQKYGFLSCADYKFSMSKPFFVIIGVTNLSSSGVIMMVTIRLVRNQLAKRPLKSDIGNCPLKQTCQLPK